MNMIEEQDKKINEMIKSITKVALSDGKITPEEAELIERVQINVLIYDNALEDALDDGIITDEEKVILDALKMEILNDAWEIASISDGIDENELKMLEILLRDLKQ